MNTVSLDTVVKAYRWRVDRWRRARRPDLERVFFLHLPKCAGTSVAVAIRDVYARSAYSTVHLDPHAADRAAEAMGAPRKDLRRKLLNYNMNSKENRYISGHFPFSSQAWRSVGDRWRHITILRDPVSRWISNFLYNKYKKNDDYRINSDISEFVDSERGRYHGLNYVANLTDLGPGVSWEGDRAIAEAIENVSRFHVVGVLERMDGFIRDCSSLIGTPLVIGHRRKSPKPDGRSREEISPEVLQRIQDVCAPNQRVYEAVLSRIDQNGSWLNR